MRLGRPTDRVSHYLIRGSLTSLGIPWKHIGHDTPSLEPQFRRCTHIQIDKYRKRRGSFYGVLCLPLRPSVRPSVLFHSRVRDRNGHLSSFGGGGEMENTAEEGRGGEGRGEDTSSVRPRPSRGDSREGEGHTKECEGCSSSLATSSRRGKEGQEQRLRCGRPLHREYEEQQGLLPLRPTDHG